MPGVLLLTSFRPDGPVFFLVAMLKEGEARHGRAGPP
jgi:hypothetical protein